MAGVRIEGLNKELASLKKLGVSVDDLKDIMFKIGSHVAEQAQGLTPVRTGKLRSTIRASKAQRKAVVRMGSKATYYGSFLEYGSIHNQQIGMVHEAVEANQTYAAQQLEHELDSLVRKYNLN